MSKPRSPALSRVAVLALALVSLTCSDDGGGVDGNGLISGDVYLAEPVAGATVTVNRWDGGVVGAEVCRATTDDAGHYACQSGKYFGVMLVTATGGHTTEQGAALTLPAGAVLRAPLLDLLPQEQRTVHLNPLTEVIVALGAARATAGQDADFVNSVARAHAVVRAHVDADPVTVAPKPVTATTAFDEAAKISLVLRGLGEYAHLAAVDQAVTVQAISTRSLLDQLVTDASSAEARLDGNGIAEVLSVGPSCQLLMNCTMEQLACYNVCHIYTNSLRSRLGAAILSWLRTPANATGLDKTDVLAWLTAMKDNVEPDLFGAEGVEDFDRVGPTVTWVTPAADQVFTGGSVAIDVTADDPLGVASLEVVVELATPVTVTDTDPAPAHVVASLPLAGLPEGPLVLRAIAHDTDDNLTDLPRSIVLNLISGGTISGTVVKARLGGATVTAYRFANGVRGAAVGSTTTATDGSFVNLAIADGTTGPLLLETTGGTYAEDSLPATSVTLDVTETLRTVLPAYTDGAALAGVVVSPLTTLAEAYLSYLTSVPVGGTDLAARWTTAATAVETHFGVANIRDITPAAPAQIDTLAAADRYGLVLVGLSRLAWAASAQGGGDAGAFGPAVNAQTVTRTWARDLADGCWNGRAGTTTLTYGGATALTEEASRLHLAQAIVAYLADGAHNQTAFTSAADVLPLLDTLSQGGPSNAPGACPGGGLFTTPGDTFDRTGPVVTWTQVPASTDVRGTIMVAATCADALDPNPMLAISAPAGTVDQDGDTTNQNIRATFDTTTRADGPLAIVVDGTDASGNHSDSAASTRTFTVDNTAPVVTITAPAMDGQFLRPPVTLGWTVVEANPMATTALLDAATPVTPGFQVAAEGAHALTVTVTDRAGGSATATRTFTIDNTAPVLTVTAPANGSFVRGPVTLSWTVSDANPGTTTTATLDGSPIVSGATTNAEGSHTLVVNATDAAGNPAAQVTRTFTVDNTPPVLTVTAISGFVRGPVTLTFSATDNFPPATITTTLDGVGFVSGGQVNTEMAHTLVVNAVDQAGNMAATITRTFTIDNTAPVLTVTAPANGSFIRGPVTLSWTVSDANPGATASATLDGVAIVSGATTNDEGAHTLVVNGVDAAGNAATTVTRTFTVDNTPPVITITGVVDGGAYQSGVAISYSATDANPGTTISATANGVNHNSGQSLFTAAGYTLVVTATDAAGNAATASRRFLVDSTPPNLSIRSQTPTGSYVKTPLTIVVDGTDNLQVSGIAGLAGSLAAPVTLAVTATSNGSPVSPTGGDVVNGDSSRTRTATFAGVADGPLVATFAMADRSGNAATQRTVNVTVDNTAPTNVALDSAAAMGFVSANSAYWTAAARPSLSGTVTEAYPGATVALLNGAILVGTGAVTGSTWTAAFTTDVPESTGFDITVRITDAAGNVGTAPVQRIARDITGPRITSVVKQVSNEANDTVNYPTPGSGVAMHVHAPPSIDLGEAGALPPTVCRDVPKYAYLTAVAPQATQMSDNTLTFKWAVSDQSAAATLGGAGVDGMTFEWVATHVASGVATPVNQVTGVDGGADTWAVDVPLHRDGGAQAVPALGAIVAGVSQVREGRFDVELRAKDKLGNSTTLVRCMNYQPIGVPVEAVSPVALTSGTNSLPDYTLTGNSAISQLLNATDPGRGMMALTVRNPTSDPVVLTLTPTGSTGTYSENWSFLRVPSAAAVTTAINCGNIVGGVDNRITTGVCGQGLSGLPPAPTEVTTNAALATQLVVRVWPALAPEIVVTQPTPQTFRFSVAPNTNYTVHVGLRDLSPARYASTAGNVEASTQYWYQDAVNHTGQYRTMSYTGLSAIVPFVTSGNGVDVTCVNLEAVETPAGSGDIYYTCRQTRRFGAVRYLTSVGAGFAEVAVQAQSLASGTTTYGHDGFTTIAKIVNYSWTRTETPQ